MAKTKQRKQSAHTRWDHPDMNHQPAISCKDKSAWKTEAQALKFADREGKFQGRNLGIFCCSLCRKYHITSRFTPTVSE